MTHDDCQQEIFAFLLDPGHHDGKKVTRVDTHAAVVFLVGERAYKVKRAVKFPFLDFSTLDRRKAALEAEIAANKPFAPELYIGLIPVVRHDEGLWLGGDGDAVEWVLEMHRFDENQTLDHLAAENRIDRGMAETLARSIAAAHTRAPVVDAGPWIAALRDYVEQNEGAFREFPTLFPIDAAASLTAASRAALERLQGLLEARGKAGLVRRGHGDLHLGNIALIDGTPTLFDALEFDPLVASGDVLYDLAFLLMDLIGRKLSTLANVVLNAYFNAAKRTDDLDALATLPLFMSLRAAIRAKVTAAKLAEARDPAKIEEDARTYFSLACRLIAPPPPRLIAVGGLSGTGKSVLARNLAPFVMPEPGAVVLRSDLERKALFDAGETERLPQSAYSTETTARVYASLADKARRALTAGHSAIVDAMFAREEERAAIEQMAHTHHFDFQAIFLTADLDTRMTRVGARVNDASDANGSIAQAQEKYDLSQLKWKKVDASGTPEQTLALAKDAVMRDA
jgi:aminoglycoside phosphotransferase family enzyme/predicted kinase